MEKLKNYLTKNEDFVKVGGVWFLLCSFFMFFSLLAFFLVTNIFRQDLVITILDIFLLILVYIFLNFAKKIDSLVIAELREDKYSYVELFKLNDLGIIKPLLLHLFYALIFWFIPKLGFILIIILPLILSFIRKEEVGRKKFPMF